MDLLFVSRCLPYPLTSGDSLLLDHLSRELAARGHHLELLAFDLQGRPVDANLDGRTFAKAESIPERRRSALDYLARLPRLFPDSSGRCWNPAMWRAIERRLKDRRFDVVHFFGGAQVYEFRNLVAGRTPTLITPYDSYTLYLQRMSQEQHNLVGRLQLWLRGRMARYFERRMYAGFGRVVMVTPADASCLRGLAPDLPIEVITNGVDDSYYCRTTHHRAEPVLIFVGNLAYQPNAVAARQLIAEIFPKVKSAVPSARAVIVGPNPPPELMRLASPDAEVTGLVPDIRPFLERATCFVSPLSQGTGIRNKILEAMSMDLAVAATPVSCEGICVRDGEDVLLGSTGEELARAAIRLLRDEKLRRDLGRAGRRLVQRDHSWKQVAARYESLYDELAGSAQVASRPRESIAGAR